MALWGDDSTEVTQAEQRTTPEEEMKKRLNEARRAFEENDQLDDINEVDPETFEDMLRGEFLTPLTDREAVREQIDEDVLYERDSATSKELIQHVLVLMDQLNEQEYTQVFDPAAPPVTLGRKLADDKSVQLEKQQREYEDDPRKPVPEAEPNQFDLTVGTTGRRLAIQVQGGEIQLKTEEDPMFEPVELGDPEDPTTLYYQYKEHKRR